MNFLVVLSCLFLQTFASSTNTSTTPRTTTSSRSNGLERLPCQTNKTCLTVLGGSFCHEGACKCAIGYTALSNSSTKAATCQAIKCTEAKDCSGDSAEWAYLVCKSAACHCKEKEGLQIEKQHRLTCRPVTLPLLSKSQTLRPDNLTDKSPSFFEHAPWALVTLLLILGLIFGTCGVALYCACGTSRVTAQQIEYIRASRLSRESDQSNLSNRFSGSTIKATG